MCLADSTTSKEVRESGLALPALRLTFGSHYVIVFIGRQGQGQLGLQDKTSPAAPHGQSRAADQILRGVANPEKAAHLGESQIEH
jgi:hypothetical protein